MTPPEKQPERLFEFIFGLLSTPEGLTKRARTVNFGFYHDSVLKPIDPRPDEDITITIRAGAGVALSSVVDSLIPRLVISDPLGFDRLSCLGWESWFVVY